ncbi:hypothetical protein D1007_46407 [Hordeum vulgare]|nr:hypothetical protein D1007_46407 [Hordeum vulgare]
MTTEAAEAEAARNRPPPVPQLITQAEKMAFLVITIQGTEKNIQEIMQNNKSLERVVETKFHNTDLKVTELTTIVRELQHEVDSVEIPRSKDEDEDEDDDDDEDDSPPPATTSKDLLSYAERVSHKGEQSLESGRQWHNGVANQPGVRPKQEGITLVWQNIGN